MDYGTYNHPKWIDNVVLRFNPKKRWLCGGDGARKANHAPKCPIWIELGSGPYIEYIGETPSYQSGTRHSMECAEAFFTHKSADLHEPGVIDYSKIARPA